MVSAVRRLTLLLGCLLLAGCGDQGPTDEQQVRTTLNALAEGTAKKDYQRLCDDVFAPQLLEDLEEIALPCEVALRQGLEDVENPRLTIGRITVRGSKASAQVKTTAEGQEPSNDIVELVKTDGKWRVSSLAGSPAGSPTPSASPSPSPSPTATKTP